MTYRFRSRPAAKLAPYAALLLAACAPWVVSPAERVRVSGVVRDSESAPLEIEVYERCSRRFLVFSTCPGKLLGAAKIAKPGSFLVEVRPSSPELAVVAFRGSAQAEASCAAETVSVDRLSDRLELHVAPGRCPLARPSPRFGAGGGGSASHSSGGHAH